MLPPHTKLAGGRYIVQRQLGAGAMAEVYLVTDTHRQAPVALKMLRADLALDTAFEDYFRKEAHVMQALQHPNIVRFYEPLRDGEMFFLVLDYIDGPNLQKYLFGQKLLPIADALHIAQVLATALDYAHANGVIHRDLKPANVLLAFNGTILLSDFGVARVAGTTTTAAGMVGSPAYMAPEQIRGGAVTAATDQYSLAVLLWELITGRRPFVGATTGLHGATLGERVLEEHLNHPPPSGVLPAELDLPLRKALSKRSSQRFSSCTEMVQQVVRSSTAVPTTLQQWSAKILASQAPIPPPLPPGPTSPPPPPPPGPWQRLLRYLPELLHNRRFRGVAITTAVAIGGAILLRFWLINSIPAPPTTVTTGIKKFWGGAEYTGELINGLANGQGTITYANGAKCTGAWKDDMFHGQGTCTYSNRDRYTGGFQRHKINGQGTMDYANGDTYTGEWKDGVRVTPTPVPTNTAAPKATNTSTGVITGTKDLDGGEYVGELSDGMANGQGTWTSLDGVKYEGEFKDDMFDGQGTWTSPDGVKYEGAWKDDKRNGQGTYTYSDGAKYTGEWLDNERTGQGTWTSPDGVKYEGAWKDDKRNGQGTMTWTDGETYTGAYKDDIRNGQGTYTYSDGAKYTGEWLDNERTGQGTLTLVDDTTYTGAFKDNMLSGQGTAMYANGDKYEGAFMDYKRNGQGTYTYADGTVETGIWKDGELLR